MTNLVFSKDMNTILDNIDLSKLGKKVAIKVHFGEKGCDTYINPDHVKKVYDKMIALGKEAALIECNVLYKGSRTVEKDHLQTAKDHGFTFAPIHVLDGEKGQDHTEIDLSGKDLSIKSAKIGKGLEDYDSLVVVTHFKGHLMGGFGGSIKNIGMGLGSRSGKLHMHATISPSINKKKCVACEKCIELCPADAITLVDGKAYIDSSKCIGCAQCIEVCPEGAANVPWSSIESREFQQRLIGYSHAVLEIVNGNAVYINVLENITKECDCWGTPQKPVMEDIGILAGHDPIAIDLASRDLVNEKAGKDILREMHKVDTDILLDYGQKTGLGQREHVITDLDK